MTYSKLIEKINSDTTGIAKGYDISFLQDEFVCRYKPGSLDELIAKDLEMFKEIEKELLETKEPKEGDFVEYDGEFARISRNHGGDTFQLSNKIGVYVSRNGYSQASGCTWDPDLDYIESKRLRFNNLKLTPKLKKGECWAFSQEIAGGSRGVNYEIDFKVWSLNKEIKTETNKNFKLVLQDDHSGEIYQTIVDNKDEIVSISIGSSTDEDGNAETVCYAFESNVELFRESGDLSLEEITDIANDIYTFHIMDADADIDDELSRCEE